MTAPLHDVEPRRRPWFGAAVTVLAAAVIGVAVAAVPREQAPLPAIARQALTSALPRLHSTEPVNAIVYAIRAFDTIGETFILLAAVVGIGLLCRRREPRAGYVGEETAARREQREVRVGEHGETIGERDAMRAEAAEIAEGPQTWPALPDAAPLGRPGPERAAAMTVMTRAGIRVVAPLLAVAGIYLMAWGFSPGGGFPAGAVALGVALLMYVSTGYRRVRRVLRPEVMEPAELGGGFAIVLLALAGLAWGGSVAASFLPLGKPETIRSGGAMQVLSLLEFVEVGTGLILATIALLSMAHDWAGGNADGNAGEPGSMGSPRT